MPIVVTPEQASTDCAEMWCDPLQLDLAVSQPIDYNLAEQACVEATWLLSQLTGERFHGTQCWVDDYELRRGQGCRIELTHWPVGEVVSVSRVDLCADEISATGLGTELDNWCYLGQGMIKLCCGNGAGYNPYLCSCRGQQTIRVHYSTDNNLAPGAGRVAEILAKEYVKSCCNLPCALPDRITSITRSGETWTVLDPQDFLDKGRTGIARVDQWLAGVNLNGYVRVYDPRTRPRQLNSTIVGCGEGCQDSL